MTSGTVTTVIHAPSVNLAATMMSSAIRVVAVPTALTPSRSDRRPRPATPPERISRSQCDTIPACDSVKVRKAPMANKGMSRSVMPPKPTRSSPAVTVR